MLTMDDVKSMFTQQRKIGGGKRAWGIHVEQTWVPFFTASNVRGATHIPSDVLGAPERLALDNDGSIKLSKTGRPVTRVHPVLAEHVKVVQDKFVSDLQGYTGVTARELPDAYRAEVDAYQQAGQVELQGMLQSVDDFLASLAAQRAADAAKLIAAAIPTPSENGNTPKGRKEKAAV